MAVVEAATSFHLALGLLGGRMPPAVGMSALRLGTLRHLDASWAAASMRSSRSSCRNSISVFTSCLPPSVDRLAVGSVIGLVIHGVGASSSTASAVSPSMPTSRSSVPRLAEAPADPGAGGLLAQAGEHGDLRVRSALHHPQVHRFPLILGQQHERPRHRAPDRLRCGLPRRRRAFAATAADRWNRDSWCRAIPYSHPTAPAPWGRNRCLDTNAWANVSAVSSAARSEERRVG